MARNYFEEIALPEQPVEKKKADPTQEYWPTREEFDMITDRIAKELDKIQTGTSNLCAYPRYFNQNEPVMRTFHKMRTEPTFNNWQTFMQIAEQDLGLKAAQTFSKWFEIIFRGREVSYK